MSLACGNAAISLPGKAFHERKLGERITGRIKQGVYSKVKRYGLRRDITLPLKQRPNAKIPISVRLLKEGDLDILLPLEEAGTEAEKREMTWRRDFWRKIPHGCYVAVDLRHDVPCYMQWLVSDNDLLAQFRCFPRLGSDEALLEQAYTAPSHRGLGIMSAAMSMIAERGKDLGARHILTFVEESNAASLKGCWRAGFQPYLLHRRTQFGFGTVIHNSFKKLAPAEPGGDAGILM